MPDRRLIVAPSLLAADFARLRDEIQRVEAGGADWLHLDVMDGHFVPNLTIGPVVVEWVRKATKLPLDCHLMIEEPERYAPDFAAAGADTITFHAEAVATEREWRGRGFAMSRAAYDRKRLDAAIDSIRSRGKRVGVAINPDTPAEVVDFADRVDLFLVMTVWPGFGGQKFIDACVPKIAAARGMRSDLDIEVDGGLSPDTVARAAAAGANVIVAGTAVFRQPDPAAVIRELRERCVV
ncbi:MAG: ribulose-phosphate 3-epimerase [Planctomycetes bacterium]|nr:ribulose-phosphate 3-epimerase [Planctomycetota bacterium]